MKTLKLYRGTDVVGIITEPQQAGPDFSAKLELTPAASKWKALFDYIMGPKEPGADPPVELNIWEDWYIEDENGVMRPIHPPGLPKDAKFIMWRWWHNKKV